MELRARIRHMYGERGVKGHYTQVRWDTSPGVLCARGNNIVITRVPWSFVTYFLYFIFSCVVALFETTPLMSRRQYIRRVQCIIWWLDKYMHVYLYMYRVVLSCASLTDGMSRWLGLVLYDYNDWAYDVRVRCRLCRDATLNKLYTYIYLFPIFWAVVYLVATRRFGDARKWWICMHHRLLSL